MKDDDATTRALAVALALVAIIGSCAVVAVALALVRRAAAGG